MEPRLHRDLLIEFGEQIVQRSSKYVNSTTFKYLFINEIIREASLNKLAKFKVLTIDNGHGRLSERNTEAANNLHFNFVTDTKALHNLKSLIKIMIAARGKFVTEIHLNSFAYINVSELMDALCLLKDVTFISFPYELHVFNGVDSDQLSRLIGQNEKSLNCLKHVTSASLVPKNLRHNLEKVVSTTLRNGTLTEEEDFYAFYGKDLTSNNADEEASKNDDTFTMSISVHRKDHVFRAAKRVFIKRRVSKIKLRVVYHFDASTAIGFLNKLKSLNSSFTSLQELDLEMTIMDSDPTLEEDLYYDTSECIVPHSARHINEMAQSSVEWLRTNKLPFKFRLTTLLEVDFERKEHDENLLTNAAKETLPYFPNLKMETKVKPGVVELYSKIPISDDTPQYEVRVKFRVFSFTNVSPKFVTGDEHIFRSEYCFL